MLGNHIVQSIGKNTKNWVSLSISDIFKNSLTGMKHLRCYVRLTPSSWQGWGLLILKTELSKLGLKCADFIATLEDEPCCSFGIFALKRTH